jgi:hypothetical protein
MNLPTPEELERDHTAYKKEIIIDSLGLYLTRRGNTVHISEIGDPLKSTANCKGYLITKTRSGRIKRTWALWMPNGAYKFIHINVNDIISKKIN